MGSALLCYSLLIEGIQAGDGSNHRNAQDWVGQAHMEYLMMSFSGDRLCTCISFIEHLVIESREEGGRTTYIECGVQKLRYPLHIEHVWLPIR